MQQIKARFQLNSVKEYQGNYNSEGAAEVELLPIYYEPSSEHRSFTDFTPSGNFTMYTTNPDVVEILKKYGKFEVTLTPLEDEDSLPAE